MTERTILALDLGTKTGWALNGFVRFDIKTEIFSDEASNISGTMDFSNRRFEGGGMRYLRFCDWLDEISRDREINAIYFEEVVRHLGVDASHTYGGFLGTLTSWCERRFIPYQGVPVQTIKKYITGKGNASKHMVIEAVNSRGYNITDHNEADAMALLLYVESLGKEENERDRSR
jgi:crossover junction endodeoxyribonuclease RuvC